MEFLLADRMQLYKTCLSNRDNGVCTFQRLPENTKELNMRGLVVYFSCFVASALFVVAALKGLAPDVRLFTLTDVSCFGYDAL